MALSPNGRILASPSEDRTVRLWDIENGQLLRILEHEMPVACVAWSPNGNLLATGSCGGYYSAVNLWDPATGNLVREFKGKHYGSIYDIKWSQNGKNLVSAAEDTSIFLWNVESGDIICEFSGHASGIFSIALSPDEGRLCSGSLGGTVRLWNITNGLPVRTLRGYGDFAAHNYVTWSPDGEYVASGSGDCTIRIWNIEKFMLFRVLMGHTSGIIYTSFLDEGRLLASLAIDGVVIFWRTDTWEEVARVSTFCNHYLLSSLAIHPWLPIVATPAAGINEIDIWDINISKLLFSKPTVNSTQYVNAKVVLLGESGVGKSGLGIRMAEREFRLTDSTHGAQFWHLPVDQVPGLPPNLYAEVTLWDFAGQPDYRLVLQLFLDDIDAALLLFDCSDPNDPFRGVPYWAKVLKKQSPPHAVKFLVSSRCDASPVTVDRKGINRALFKYGLDEYFKTSAKNDEGVQELFEQVIAEHLLARATVDNNASAISDYP